MQNILTGVYGCPTLWGDLYYNLSIFKYIVICVFSGVRPLSEYHMTSMSRGNSRPLAADHGNSPLLEDQHPSHPVGPLSAGLGFRRSISSHFIRSTPGMGMTRSISAYGQEEEDENSLCELRGSLRAASRKYQENIQRLRSSLRETKSSSDTRRGYAYTRQNSSPCPVVSNSFHGNKDGNYHNNMVNYFPSNKDHSYQSKSDNNSHHGNHKDISLGKSVNEGHHDNRNNQSVANGNKLGYTVQNVTPSNHGLLNSSYNRNNDGYHNNNEVGNTSLDNSCHGNSHVNDSGYYGSPPHKKDYQSSGQKYKTIVNRNSCEYLDISQNEVDLDMVSTTSCHQSETGSTVSECTLDGSVGTVDSSTLVGSIASGYTSQGGTSVCGNNSPGCNTQGEDTIGQLVRSSPFRRSVPRRHSYHNLRNAYQSQSEFRNKQQEIQNGNIEVRYS